MAGEPLVGAIDWLLDLIGREFPLLSEQIPEFGLLCDHDGHDDYELGEVWQEAGGGGRAGGRDRILTRRVRAALTGDVRRRAPSFLAAVRRALSRDSRGRPRRIGAGEERGVVPATGRRELIWLAAGFPPSLYPVLRDTANESDELVHLYVDVSGSTDEVQPVVFALVRRFHEWFGGVVHLFSNRIVDTSLSELRRGLARTTGGTDFNCVAQHATSRRFRRILIVTDGRAHFSRRWLQALRVAGTRMIALLVGYRPERRTLERAGAEIVVIRSGSLARRVREYRARRAWAAEEGVRESKTARRP